MEQRKIHYKQCKKENIFFLCIIILFLGICTPKFSNNIELGQNLFICIHMIILHFYLCKLYKIKINIFVRGHLMTGHIVLYDYEIVCPFYKTSIISQQPSFTKRQYHKQEFCVGSSPWELERHVTMSFTVYQGRYDENNK